MHYTDINSATIDRWAENGWEWGQPITHEQFVQAQNGHWDMVLTPNKPVPKAWFPPLTGCRVLGLAAGGGQQMPIFAALGAACTVLDYSQKQLDSEWLVSQREGYDITILRADMTRPLPFDSDSFDLIFHPVANCYIEEVLPLWRECCRVLKKGGLLMAGMDNGFNYLFDEDGVEVKYRLPFNPLKDAKLMEMLKKTDSGVQFSHTLEEQLRGQLQAGLTIVDLYEDTNGSGPLFDFGVPCFWASLAKK